MCALNTTALHDSAISFIELNLTALCLWYPIFSRVILITVYTNINTDWNSNINVRHRTNKSSSHGQCSKKFTASFSKIPSVNWRLSLNKFSCSLYLSLFKYWFIEHALFRLTTKKTLCIECISCQLIKITDEQLDAKAMR